MITIKLISASELDTIIPLLQALNPKMDPALFHSRLAEIRKTNYQCIGAYDGEKLAGISGFWILNKFYVGKHIESDNVVVLPEYRNRKIGEQLMAFIYDLAREQGCNAAELNVYVSNSPGVKFYLNQGFRILGFHMQKMLSNK